MKCLLSFLALLLILTCFCSSSCKKDKNKNPVDQLPPETQTGANTFGCLVDGKAFIPKGSPLGGPIKKAAYQFVNGSYYFVIAGSDRSNPEDFSVVQLRSDSLQLSVGSYLLSFFDSSGYLGGGVTFSKISQPSIRYFTNQVQTGELIIKKLDEIDQIVSGTFWFNAIDTATGKILQIREGRFDMPYVK